MTDQTAQIHENVRKHYGAIALNSDQSCCGDTCGCGRSDHALTLYDSADVASLPVDVTGVSLGCGDPVTIAELKPGEHIVDLGSGGGIDCFLAASQVGDSGYVIGVDMTPAMLDKANANKSKMGVQNVEFRQGQIEDLPIDDNSIDVIMSNCVINLSPQKANVFGEAFRVLKPGGRGVVSDIVTEGDFSAEMRADALKWSQCVSGAIDVEQYIGLMREAGFVNVTVKDKVDASEKGVTVDSQADMPRIFSARIIAHKPA